MRIMKDVLSKIDHALGTTLFALSLVIMFFAPSARGQDTAAALPPGPFPSPAPAFSQWVVTFSYPEDKSNSLGANSSSGDLSARVRLITTTKTGEIIHEEIANGTGVKTNDWYVGSSLYFKGAGATLWGEQTSGKSSPFVAFPANGFRGLDWITREGYVGTVAFAGHPCLAFVLGAPPKIDLSDPSQLDSLSTYALLDAQTLLPVKVQLGGSTRFYQFKDAPTEKLSLPLDLVDQLKKAQEAEARLNQRMPRPY